MQCNPDQPHFEADMHHEVTDLLATDTVKLSLVLPFLLIIHFFFQSSGAFAANDVPIGPSPNTNPALDPMVVIKLKV